MKFRFLLSLLLIVCFSTTSCARKNDKEPVIKFKTTEGTIVVKLYPKTEKHRDNFVKLVESGYYDGVLFHRVIRDFMIQAGDPDSKNAGRKAELGSGDVKYTIPAEFVYPEYYHKKGALAAARQGDDTNPQRASSGAQFYIVQGKVFDDAGLNKIEARNRQKAETALVRQLSDSIVKARRLSKPVLAPQLLDSVVTVVHQKLNINPVYKFTEQQRNDYKTIGGTPHLDGEYTVFGEVIKGLEIVSNISRAKTGKFDRPATDVRILKAKRIR
ncbi:MAG: peptidylprolyl isomerase [Bacteroidia bacterium]|jgi:cyclophilin family peptidyl-prolyl cis-trans isomerase|nr:peptidylprolyl isomerase [Bacteroidia bacterium]